MTAEAKKEIMSDTLIRVQRLQRIALGWCLMQVITSVIPTGESSICVRIIELDEKLDILRDSLGGIVSQSFDFDEWRIEEIEENMTLLNNYMKKIGAL